MVFSLLGNEGNAVDALLDEELRELGVVTRGLAADTDFAALCAAGGDDLGDHLFYSGVFVRCLLPRECGASPPGGLTRGFGCQGQGSHRSGRLC